jgi:large subunit ribosomal protein L1
MEIKDAIAELRKEKKRKFVQTLDVIVNLKEFDVRKEALNTFISVPHAGEKRIAAFLTKRSNVLDTITELDFEKYKETRDMKKLAKKYDYFIAVAPMMAKIATKFGRVFGPMSKMPSPQAGIVPKDDDDTVKAMFDKMQKVIRVKNKEMAIKLPVGKEDMKDSDLQENIEAVLAGLEKVLPRGKENIREVIIKFTMSKPVVVIAVKGTAQSEVKK